MVNIMYLVFNGKKWSPVMLSNCQGFCRVNSNRFFPYSRLLVCMVMLRSSVNNVDWIGGGILLMAQLMSSRKQ